MNIIISDNAAKHLKRVIQRRIELDEWKSGEGGIRIVEYFWRDKLNLKMSFEATARKGDRVIISNGIKLFIGPEIRTDLDECEIVWDHGEFMIGEFKLRRPKLKP